ncbi:unnamed protein product, partial [Closterium sp. NIES-53]
IDVIRGASAQGGRSEVPATLPVATQITLGAFAFNFTAARCANLPRFTPNATVQWMSKATPNLPSCKNLTFWSGASCSGTSSYFLTRPPSLTTNTQTILPYPTAVSARCAIDNMCQYAKCPAGSTCKTTTDTRGVTCTCNQDLYAYQGTCQTLEIAVQSPDYDTLIDATGVPTEVDARLPVATQLAVGAYSVPFDPSSRCTRVPDGTAPAGVSTPVSVQWGTTSAQGGGASAPCSSVWFFSGSSCNSGTSFSSLNKTSSSQTATITPTTPLASIDCPIASPCKYASCPNNSVCLDASGSKRATCKCDEGYIAVNGTCRDKCSLICPVNAYCIRNAVGEPQCYCNKGFDMNPADGTCVDKCSSVKCPLNKTCTKDADGTPICTCSTGFKLAPDNTTCIDKCESVTCKATFSCVRDADGNTRCDCAKGFERLPGNDTCVDKCASVKCPLNKTCTTDADRNPACTCSTGFTLAADNSTCIDKCSLVDCGPNGKCIKDADGNATCACNAGFQMPPNNLTCVDKCELVTCAANSACVKDTDGNTRCDCIKGYERLSGNDNCVDKCAKWDCGSNANCTTVEDGNPKCICNTGFSMYNDYGWRYCRDNCASIRCWPGTCTKDDNGNPSCVCNVPGYWQSADKLSCKSRCSGYDCGYGRCAIAENGYPYCFCYEAGYEMDSNRVNCVRSECYFSGCGPDRDCVYNYGRYTCKWRSPCGSCPSGATCKTIRATSAVVADVPYCVCDAGYGMTTTGCVQGSPDTVPASSITLVQDRAAVNNASRPYTFRTNVGCNQLPKEVAGNFSNYYEVHNINGGRGCSMLTFYRGDNCYDPAGMRQTTTQQLTAYASGDLEVGNYFTPRSIGCRM